MKTSGKCGRDWQEEVWRIKEGLSAKARAMGLRNYLAFAEKEADRILKTRTKPTSVLAREKRSRPYRSE
jgi:hypothetical protein